jgi:hypothetical protein
MELNEVSDQELAFMVKKNADNDALQELIVRHSGIYMDMLKAYGGKSFNQNQLNDFIEQKDFVIYEAAKQYEPSRAKFSTFLANKTKYMCLTEKSKFQKNSREVRFDDVDFSQRDTGPSPYETCLQKESFKKVIDMIMGHKDERVKKIFKLRYFGGKGRKLLPWKKVAVELDLSAQSCINIHDRTIELFKNRVKNDQTIEF